MHAALAQLGGALAELEGQQLILRDAFERKLGQDRVNQQSARVDSAWEAVLANLREVVELMPSYRLYASARAARNLFAFQDCLQTLRGGPQFVAHDRPFTLSKIPDDADRDGILRGLRTAVIAAAHELADDVRDHLGLEPLPAEVNPASKG